MGGVRRFTKSQQHPGRGEDTSLLSDFILQSRPDYRKHENVLVVEAPNNFLLPRKHSAKKPISCLCAGLND